MLSTGDTWRGVPIYLFNRETSLHDNIQDSLESVTLISKNQSHNCYSHHHQGLGTTYIADGNKREGSISTHSISVILSCFKPFLTLCNIVF